MRAIGLRKTSESFTDDATFHLVRTYIKAKALLCASIHSSGEERRSTGLVAGHAYSLLDARAFAGGINLVRLVRTPTGARAPVSPLGPHGTHRACSVLSQRNPWGSFEWKGAWSDGAKEWKEHRKIRKVDNRTASAPPPSQPH